MKEIIIPITWEHVMKFFVLSLSILTIIGIIYGIKINDRDTTIFSIIMGGFVTLFVTGLCSMNYNWDMNPFHKVGYCIRLAETWELKNSKQQSESKVDSK